MAVNYGSYEGWRELSDKGEKAVGRVVGAYAEKIKQNREDEKIARQEATREAQFKTQQEGRIHEVDSTLVEAPDAKLFKPKTWGNIFKLDKKEFTVKDTGENTLTRDQYEYDQNEDFKRKQAEALIRDGKSGVVYNMGEDGGYGEPADEYNTVDGKFDPISSQDHQYKLHKEEAEKYISDYLQSGELNTDGMLNLAYGGGDQSLEDILKASNFSLKPGDITSIKNMAETEVKERLKQIQTTHLSGMNETQIKEFFNEPENEKLWDEYSKLNFAIHGENTSKEIVAKKLGPKDKTKTDFGFSDEQLSDSKNLTKGAFDKYQLTGVGDDENSIPVGKANWLGKRADLKFAVAPGDRKDGKATPEQSTLLMAALPETLHDMPTSMDDWTVKYEGGKHYLIESDISSDDKVEIQFNKETGSLEWRDAGSRGKWLKVDDDFEEFTSQF